MVDSQVTGTVKVEIDEDTKRFLNQFRQMPYTGLIPRQDLVDFCQGEMPRINQSNEELLHGLHYAEQQGNIHTIHALNEGLMENFGYQKALRAVCEWAKAHMIEPEPIEDVDVSELKARFNNNES